MPLTLSHDAPDFARRLEALLADRTDTAPEVGPVVADIVADVRARGVEAVVDLTRHFDGWEATPATLAVPEPEIEAATRAVPDDQRRALETAAERIRAYHRRQMPEDALWEDATGTTLGWRWTALEAAGLYVPGGLARYPSSVLMNAIPAKVAGVSRLAIAAPAPGGRLDPLVLAAARIAGADAVYRIGGAQAIAAMAYGAGPVAAVDKITGPGNAYVAEAKRQVFGRVGIDMIAGPSEVLVIADADNDPDRIALDLMAQAEHDAAAQAILVTDDAPFGAAVGRAVDAALTRLSRAEIAGASWRDHGAILIARDLAHAAELANRIAPEHLELAVADPPALLARIRNAGAVFLGALTPEAIGDYVGGPNHVLPTAGTARFSSGLSVLDFLKRSTIMGVSEPALATLGPAAETLARAEGLEAHALSIRHRLDRAGGAR